MKLNIWIVMLLNIFLFISCSPRKDKSTQATSPPQTQPTTLPAEENSEKLYETPKFSIYIVDIQENSYTKITDPKTNYRRPLFSPSEQYLVFIKVDTPQAIAVYDTDTRETNILIETKGKIGHYSWSPDSKSLIFIELFENTYKLKLCELETGKIRELFTWNKEISFPSWSPYNGKIAFSAGNETSYEIYTVDPSSKERQQVTFSQNGYAIAPSWSPTDGKLVYIEKEIAASNFTNTQFFFPDYQELYGIDGSVNGHVVLLDTETNQKSYIFSQPPKQYYLTTALLPWSEDGKYIGVGYADGISIVDQSGNEIQTFPKIAICSPRKFSKSMEILFDCISGGGSLISSTEIKKIEGEIPSSYWYSHASVSKGLHTSTSNSSWATRKNLVSFDSTTWAIR